MKYLNRHPKIQERITSIFDRADEEAHALNALAAWVDQYHLHPLIDHASYFSASTDYINERSDDGSYHHRTVDRFRALIQVNATHKAELRPILLAAFDSFDKGYNVDNYSMAGPHLIETWTHTWDRIDNPIGADAYNAISIQFRSPASAGQRLSSTCTIGRIVQDHAPESRLVVTCKRKSDS